MSAARRWPIGLAAAIVLPILAFAIAISALYDRQARDALEVQLEIAARSARAAVDVRLSSELAALRTAAAAIDLAGPGMAAAADELRRVVENNPDWLVVWLTEPSSGRVVMRTAGRDVPEIGPPPAALQDGPVGTVSRVEDGFAYVTLQVPVMRGDEVVFLLTAAMRAFIFSRLLQSLHLPKDWLAGLVDQEYAIVGRNVAAGDRDAIVGLKATPSFVEQLTAWSGEPFFADTHLGDRMYVASRPSLLSAWSVNVAAPADMIEGPLRRQRLVLLSGGTAAVVLTLALASVLIHSFTRLRQEEALQRQKDMLLQESNHRIKNSLQLVASLLALQAHQVRDPGLRAQFQEARDRIDAVSRVHEQIYKSSDTEVLDLDTCIRELCDRLALTYGTSEEVQLAVTETSGGELPTDKAIPLMLIANELITNGFKHSAVDDRKVILDIRCRRTDNTILLSVASDGRDLPPDFDPEAAEGFGMRLVTGLVRQFDGTLEVDRLSPGARFRVVVPA